MNLATMELFKTLDGGSSGVVIEGETLKKCQKVLLGIAEDFISMCEKEGIWYQLSGGTALGAVREKGFIAWDDDIDLNVKSKDFERLGELMAKHYGDKYTVLDYRLPGYVTPMGRIMLNNSVFLDRTCLGTDYIGFFVDIFPIENTYDNALLRRLHGILCMIVGGLLSCRNFYARRKFYRDLAKNNPQAAKDFNVKIFIGWCVSFLSTKTWARITRKVYGLCKNEASKFVSIPSGRKHYFGEMYARDGMMNTTAFTFEGHQWQVARDYDTYLTALYGSDYMTPPPRKARTPYHFRAQVPGGSPELITA